MHSFRCSMGCFAGLAMLVVAGASFCSASEPQAEFALKAGWVECMVEQDGRPVANAAIVVLDAAGTKFADGETDDSGQGQFPMPAGKSFTVEIKTGKRTSDPIRLMKVDGRIEPAKVLLSYGLRPCCRFLVKREATWKAAGGRSAAPGDVLVFWVLGATAICALLCAIVFLCVPARKGSVDGTLS